MSVPLTEQKILQLRSGNRCAFLGCNAPLVKKTAFGTRLTITGEIAHIVSEKPDGPRGGHALQPGEHDKYANLIFLCSSHHTEVDAHPEVYTVERLRQMKQDHEEGIEKTVTQAKQKEQSEVRSPSSHQRSSLQHPPARYPDAQIHFQRTLQVWRLSRKSSDKGSAVR